MHEQRLAIGHWLVHPKLADGLPGNAPSDRLRFSRLQLRGSAGLAPASLSSPRGKDAQTEGHFKEREIVCVRNLPGEDGGSQLPRFDSGVSFRMADKLPSEKPALAL
jgi:hypothetical protein